MSDHSKSTIDHAGPLDPADFPIVVSGGQTGADRGAHDAAIAMGIRRGGWAPRGWRAEDGPIPPLYRDHMTEAPSSNYEQRTLFNVRDSDATLVLSFGALRPGGGSARTLALARKLDRPSRHLVVPLDGDVRGVGLDLAVGWLAGVDPARLNVAGPRGSVEPSLGAAVEVALRIILLTWRR